MAAIVASLRQTLPSWERETVIHWSSAIGRKDPFYMGHVVNVCEMVRALGEALALPSSDRDLLIKAALIHDIGKIDIPEAILTKAGPLTDSERSRLPNYCIVGQRLAESLVSFRDTGFLVRSHHERLDGSGYPAGLTGEAIPFLVRILTAADVFDAIRSERVYKASTSEDAALAMLHHEVERNWLDAEVVDVLTKVVMRQVTTPTVSKPTRAKHRGTEPRSPVPERHQGQAVDVLVVEDNDDLRKMIGIIVDMMDLTVYTAADGQQALALIRREPGIGIVLLDVVMPEMSGFEFCHALREDPALQDRRNSLHIIMVSARSDSRDKVKGLQLGAAGYLTKPFDPWELRAHISVGERVVRQQRALEAQRLLLEEMVRVEPLTGLYSRRFFEQVLREEWSRAARYRHCTSLIMVDVDHFKQVNDHYGHGCGDRVLTRVAEMLRSDLREPDVVARYGGDEFVLLMPETDIDSALRVAERLRQKVKGEPFRYPEGDFDVTVSCGVATVTDARESSLPAFVDAADRALYRAKIGGRDRTAR